MLSESRFARHSWEQWQLWNMSSFVSVLLFKSQKRTYSFLFMNNSSKISFSSCATKLFSVQNCWTLVQNTYWWSLNQISFICRSQVLHLCSWSPLEETKLCFVRLNEVQNHSLQKRMSLSLWQTRRKKILWNKVIFLHPVDSSRK